MIDGAGAETRRYPSKAEYEQGQGVLAFACLPEFIRRGDVAFQIVLSQRAERRTDVSALALYRALRHVNPSPYLFLLELDGLALVGSSPETLVKCDGVMRVGRTRSPARRRVLARAMPERLLASDKDRAEHRDARRSPAETTSRASAGQARWKWRASSRPERFSHITHLSSRRSSASYATGVTPFSLLRACFPAGTVSGAPKVRAMQIISELEGYRRGPYAGAVLYSLPGGPLDACIAIRTIVLHDARSRRCSRPGAGIVADSDPTAEHEECLRASLPALEAAIDLAEAGLDDHAALEIDNYDSFTVQPGAPVRPSSEAEVLVRRNDAESRSTEIEQLAPSQLVISPGPGRPEDAGVSEAAVRALAGRVPVLGVCLGHQAIVSAFGGTIGQAQSLVHGKATTVSHDGRGLFTGLPEGFAAGRYHSLAATSVPDCLEVSATAADGEVMAVRHLELRVDGVQFHPESVLTPDGPALARNFLGSQ